MAYSDFQDFLDKLYAAGELKKIDHPVDPYLEITEIADRVMKSGGPALLFNNPEGRVQRHGTSNPDSAVMQQPSIDPDARPQATRKWDYPVAINTMGSRKRMSMALSCDDFEEHADRLAALLKPEIPSGPIEALRKLPWLISEVKSAPPKTVKSGICKQVVMTGSEIDLNDLPVLTCWPEDGGPYITLPLVFTHDPNTGKRNVGMYRIQVHGPNKVGMHWQMHKTGMRHMEDAGKQGKRIEAAIVLGGDPSYNFAAISPLPPGIDEMMFAGFLRKKNVELVQCETVDLKVPADAEFVIEGYVEPSERELEGPFGDHTGYYSLAEPFPVLHVTAVTRRERAVYPATIVGQPPMEDGWMGKAVERIFLPLIQLTVPEIVDMHLPVAACFHNIGFISIKKKYPGHAQKIMNSIWGLGGLAFTKFVFIFDEDCDVQNVDEVLFRIGANCDPVRDTLLSRGPIDQLDHAALTEGFGGKMGFDCTHKWPGENGFDRKWPKLIQMSPDIVKRIDELWPKLGIDN